MGVVQGAGDDRAADSCAVFEVRGRDGAVIEHDLVELAGYYCCALKRGTSEAGAFHDDWLVWVETWSLDPKCFHGGKGEFAVQIVRWRCERRLGQVLTRKAQLWSGGLRKRGA